MPLLNVGFMTQDPMLADCFTVNRRLNVVGQNGRVDANQAQVYEGLYGTVTQDSPADVVRDESGQMVPKRIIVCAPFQFLTLAPGVQPDEIEWDGAIYTVLSSQPYSRFGDGHYQATAEFRGPIPPAQ